MFGLRGKRIVQAAVLLLVSSAVAYAYATGPPQGYTGAPGDYGDCTACHDTYVVNTGAGSLALGQVPGVYEPGQSYTLLVELADPQARRWGFELTGIDGNGNRAGTFAPLGPDTQIATVGPPVLDRQYIEHTLLGTFPGTTMGHTWQVQWTAPASDIGAVHFYVAGNAANDDGTDQGDYIYTNGAMVESPSSVVTLQLTSNPQGLTLDASSSYTISWSATNESNVTSYEVRYSTDGGATFPITNLIFSTTDPSVTSTDWVVPDTPTTMAEIRVL
ncbi:MAG TPA: choice-of-anchor V domain-containing protein, partial [Blastocatellia bacterium]